MDWLKGKKAYIIASLLALVQLVEFVSAGTFSLAAWVTFFKSEALAGAIAALRAGIGKVGK